MKEIPIVKNHNTVDEIEGYIKIQSNYIHNKLMNGELVLEPAFIEHPDGSLELLEVSVVPRKKE